MQYVYPEIPEELKRIFPPDWEWSGPHNQLPFQARDYLWEKKRLEKAHRRLLSACFKVALSEQFPYRQEGDEMVVNEVELARVVTRVNELFRAATSETEHNKQKGD